MFRHEYGGNRISEKVVRLRAEEAVVRTARWWVLVNPSSLVWQLLTKGDCAVKGFHTTVLPRRQGAYDSNLESNLIRICAVLSALEPSCFDLEYNSRPLVSFIRCPFKERRL